MARVTGGTIKLDSYGFYAGSVVLFDKEITDTSSSYDPRTGKFICPVSGLYLFNLNVRVSGGHWTDLDLYVNNGNLIYLNDRLLTGTWADKQHNSNDGDSGSASAVVSLKKGDMVYVRSGRGRIFRVVTSWGI